MNARRAKDLPSGKLARASVAGMAAAKVGAGRLARGARRLVGGEGPEDYREEARIVFEALSHMRGPALKLAQTLSLEMGWLPAAYQEQFQKAYYQVPPLNRAVVRRVIQAEFSKAPEELFASFEPEAFAAASLGQVHHATDASGRQLAVKVQYPGVQEALQNDLQLGQRLLAPLLRSPYVMRVMKEMEARFTEEADYRAELANTAWFHETLKMPGLHLPRPVPELSGARVLTTELMPGRHLEEWLLQHPSQEARNRACQAIWDQFCTCYFVHGRIHADPNPGNFLFADDGSVALIDFGCVKRFAPDLPAVTSSYFKACLRGDEKEVLKAYAHLGIAEADLRDLKAAVTLEFDEWMCQPFREESFDFGAQPHFGQKMLEVGRQTMGQKGIQGLTAETVMFDRNLHGYYNLFGRLGARVRMRNQWMH